MAEHIIDSPKRVSSRYLEIDEEDFDIDLNMLDIDEQEYSAERLVANHTSETFDNTKRTISGPH